jgi:hypothetical protein
LSNNEAYYSNNLFAYSVSDYDSGHPSNTNTYCATDYYSNYKTDYHEDANESTDETADETAIFSTKQSPDFSAQLSPE